MLAGLALGGLALLAAAALLGGPIAAVAAIAGGLLGATIAFAAIPQLDSRVAAREAPLAAPAAAAAAAVADPIPASTPPAALDPAPAPARAPEPIAATDPITGLPGMERLQHDLALKIGDVDRRWTLHTFLLDGFKDYNDAYGDAIGDALLAWLARKLLDAVAGDGTVYRMRGGTFALLAFGTERASAPVRDAASTALHEIGEGFHISCVVGTAGVRTEAETPEAAIELALRRAHSRRNERKVPGLRAPADATEALRLVRPRYDVATTAKRVARRLDVPAEDIEHLEAAVHLCDVGTLAVPRDILGRAGKLPEHEWRFIHLHTLVGERLLAAGLDMEPVAALVRSSHERWDGTGYPDGRAGEEIPLSSRIVFVCSAFHDMTSERPHQPALEPEEALAELERGAGTQFDPAVVAAFRQELGLTVEDEQPLESDPVTELRLAPAAE
jgi:diguanylate cyclase (GGDEF)-like protein